MQVTKGDIIVNRYKTRLTVIGIIKDNHTNIVLHKENNRYGCLTFKDLSCMLRFYGWNIERKTVKKHLNQ